MTGILTRAAKGAALLHEEMDGNLLTLDLSRFAIPEADFMSRTADRRDKFAGSGFVEWGKWLNQAGYSAINDSLFVYPTLVANQFYLGSAHANNAGSSRTNYPVCNVNGVSLHMSWVNSSNLALTNKILLPPAPSTSDLLERQDLVFLECWHEKVTDKYIVYPYGNVQSLLATDPATGLTTVNGSFSGYATYSLFGNWQASSALIGKGLVWSTMSDTNKKLFVSDPKNNVYLAEDGEYVQVRYRIRVVEGPSSDMTLVRDGGIFLWLDNSNSKRVMAKGMLTSIVGEFTSGNQSYVDSQNANSYLYGDDSATIGSYTTVDEYTTLAYKGLCFAIPIALVSRRNQGAFHPVWNPNGSARCHYTYIGGTYKDMFYEQSGGFTSVDDCFTVGSASNVGYYTGSGYISSVLSGRPDGKYYDAIYESDVLDLRSSAHKVTDLNRTLEREFNRLVAGEVRGWASGFRIAQSGTITASLLTSTTAWGSIGVEIRDTTQNLALTYGSAWVFAEDAKMYIKSDSQWYECVRIYSAADPRTSFYLHPRYGNVTADFTTAAVYDFIICEVTVSKRKADLQCDIIGDPANYPLEWITNGIMGTPLLVGENGEDLIPDGTSKTYKMSRKVKDYLLGLVSTDNGVTWTDFTSTYQSSVEGSSNSHTNSINTGRLILHFYLTEASPFETADNAEVLSLGDVWAGNYSVNTLGANLVTDLISKIPVSSRTSIEKLNTYGMSGDLLITSTGVRQPSHDGNLAVTQETSSSPAAKVLPYLTRENGKLFLQTLFKEMIYDTDWGDDSKFNVVSGVSTTTDDNANTVLIGQKRIELPFYIGDGE